MPFTFAFTQQSPVFQAAARASPRPLSPVWVRTKSHHPDIVAATTLRRQRFINVESLGQIPGTLSPQLPTPIVAECLRRYSSEKGIGNHWVSKRDVMQQRVELNNDAATHHRVTVLSPQECKWINLADRNDAASVWCCGIDGGLSMSGALKLDYPRHSSGSLRGKFMVSTPLVFSAAQIPAMGLSLKEYAQPLEVSNKWIPLRCAENVTEVLIACTAAGAVFPTDPFQPIDVTTGAPLQSPVRILPDVRAPPSDTAIESGVLNRAQLQHFMLPSSVLGNRGISTTEGAAPLKVEVTRGHTKSTFKTLRTPTSDAEVWYSVDSLTDPDMGFRVAGTYAALGETLLTAAVDENTTAPAPCDTATV